MKLAAAVFAGGSSLVLTTDTNQNTHGFFFLSSPSLSILIFTTSYLGHTYK